MDSVGPALLTVAHHYISIGPMYRVIWGVAFLVRRRLLIPWGYCAKFANSSFFAIFQDYMLMSQLKIVAKLGLNFLMLDRCLQILRF